jgi:phosphate starvation-inducible PhoH-like protein
MGKKKDKVYADNGCTLPPLQAKNPRQQEYISAIKHSKIICGTGVAGSGKTYIAARMAALMYKKGDVRKIVISRPNEIEGTRSIGLLPGTLEEKMLPILGPIISVLEEEFGKSQFEYMVKKGRIEYLPLEYIKGRTFDDCFVIIDEAEDITQDIIKVLLMRTGVNCKIVLDGDVAQHAIKARSGLAALLELSEKVHLPIAFIDFPSWDDHCVRSEEAKYLGKVFDQFNF